MISAVLRYAALVAAGGVLAFTAYLYAADGRAVAVVICLVLAGACWEAASYVRRATTELQQLHHQARQQTLAAQAAGSEPWAAWCCERGFLTHGDLHHPTHCTKETIR